MTWRNEPKPVWLISPKLYNSYLDSLLNARLYKVEGRIRYSRSGHTAYIRNLKATLETNTHLHELYIYKVLEPDGEGYIEKYYGDWYIDYEEVAVLDLGTYYNAHPILARIFGMVETLVKTGNIETDPFTDRFEIELYREPRVVLFE